MPSLIFFFFLFNYIIIGSLWAMDCTTWCECNPSRVSYVVEECLIQLISMLHLYLYPVVDPHFSNGFNIFSACIFYIFITGKCEAEVIIRGQICICKYWSHSSCFQWTGLFVMFHSLFFIILNLIVLAYFY